VRLVTTSWTFMRENSSLLAGAKNSRAIGHDILDFCERELVTLGGGGVEKKRAIIVLVKPR
jgi:hypothetical protein